MPVRPYLQKTIIELQAIFEANQNNSAELKKLKAELAHRKVPKATALSKQVSEVLKNAKTSDTKKQPNPFIGNEQPTVVAPLSVSEQIKVLPQTKSNVPKELQDAYKLFNADETSSWEDIEFTRRRLIQQFHPEKIANLSTDQRELAKIDSKKINVAFALLRKSKGI